MDISGNAYVAGQAAGSSFPTTSNAAFPSCGAGNGFITVLNSAGNGLVYSSCLGFSPYPVSKNGGIAIDTHGRAAIVGFTYTSIPTTPNAFQPSYPGGSSGFVMLFDTTASGIASLIYSSHFGIPGTVSNVGVSANAVAIDSFGNIYITGGAIAGLPTTVGAFQTSVYSLGSSCGGPGMNPVVCPDVFVAKFNPFASGSQSLIYSTYLGGVSQDEGIAIAVDASGNAYVTGQTASANFPVTPGAFQTTQPFNVGGAGVSFVTKLNASGSKLVYSTYFGGTCNTGACSSVGIQATGIAVDSLGEAYVVGSTNTPLFPVTLYAFQSIWNKPVCKTDCASAFLTKFNPAGSALIYSSYLGGIYHDVATSVAIDQTGDAYVAGHTSSVNFPVTGIAFQSSMHGTGDAFVTKFPLGGTFRVLQILPSSGGNSGNITTTIFGGGFHSGVSVKLSGGDKPAIVASSVTVGPNALSIGATFNLQSAATGPRDVVVTNSDGTVITLPLAFTILSGGAPNVQISKIGTVVVPGRATTYILTASNSGNIDSGAVPIVENLAPWFRFISSNPAASAIRQAPKAFPPGAEGNYDAFVEWDLPSLPAGGSRTFSYAVALDPSFPPGKSPSGPACVEVAHDVCEVSFYACAAVTVGVCIATPPLCFEAVASCVAEHLLCERLAGAVCAVYDRIVSSTFDPNDLTGLAGSGSARWVSGQTPLSYAIEFSNLPTATARAQQVIVTNLLNVNVDMSTLTLTSIDLPGVQVPIPPTFVPAAGQNEVTTNVDLRPSQNLLVTINAKLNPNTGLVTWTFSSVDPTTGQAPLDPLAGFLPPGADGGVSFTIKPKQGLATGTQVADQAAIVFDANAPISTPIWTNTIDNTNPVSKVSSLPATSNCPSFQVSWSGSDVGSGLQGFTIYASDSGGPFTAWQSNTAAVTATYQGTLGHSYAFYSIASDLAGNVEGAKTLAEASTVVSASTCGAAFNISGQVTKGGVALSGVSLTTLAGGAPGSKQTTDGSGNFSFSNLLAGGNYTVTPTLANYTFAPPSSTFNNLQSNQTANFIATAVTYTISGQVTKGGLAFSGVTVRLVGGTVATLTTDGLGNYNISGMPAGLSYTVTPTLANYSFSVANATFNNLQSNQTANFIGSPKLGAGKPEKVGAFNTGNWVQDANGNFAWDGTSVDRLIYWSLGQTGEVPVIGDWNGDGKSKVGLYINGTWYLDFNGNGVWDGPNVDKLVYFGGPGFAPLVGD